MNKTVFLVLTIVIASVTGGCSYLSDFSDARKELEESAKTPIPNLKSAPASSESAPANSLEDFADLDLEEDKEPTQEIAGLIPTTNAETRVRSIIRGRQDPFSVVSVVPKIKIEKEAEKSQAKSSNNANNSAREEQNPGVSQPFDNNNNNGGLPDFIEEFKAELAQRVIISGLYESNGTTKLIVQAPEEDNSRYVEVGQYLSNGQILVKSIDRNHFPAPRVILEQSGVEVTKVIGETPQESNNSVSTLPSQNWDRQAVVSNVSLNLTDVR
jgi:hypothetical protein